MICLVTFSGCLLVDNQIQGTIEGRDKSPNDNVNSPDNSNNNPQPVTPPPLSIGDKVANENSSVVFSFSEGTPPYTVELLQGAGEWDEPNSEYFTPNYPETASFKVTDSQGSSDTFNITVGGTQLYFAGGQDPTNSWVTTDTVFSSNDGATWNTIGNLPGTRFNGAMLVFKDKMYFMGGRSGSWYSHVWSSIDGITWTLVGNMPAGRASLRGAVFKKEMWIIGGYNSGTKNNVWSSADGVNWTIHNNFPINAHSAGMVVANGKLWHIGAWDEGGTEARNEVWWTTDGENWTEETDVLPHSCTDNPSSYFLGMFVMVGGCSTISMLSNDGVNWAINPMPSGSNGGLAQLNGKLFSVGAYSSISYSSVDGVNWVLEGNLPATRWGGRMVAFRPPP